MSAWVWTPTHEKRAPWSLLDRLVRAARAELALVCAERPDLGLELPNTGLPAWLIAVAAGDGEPSLDIGASTRETSSAPDALVDLVDAARAIGAEMAHRGFPLPHVQAPVIVLTGGSLLARRAQTFDLRIQLRDPGTNRRVEVRSAMWAGARGAALVPAAVARVLAELERGPPERQQGQSDPAWSDSRHVWWAEIRARLRAAQGNAGARLQIEGLLGQIYAERWDRLTPTLSRQSGHLDLLVQPGPVLREIASRVADGAGGQSETLAVEMVRDALDQLRRHPDRHPTAHARIPGKRRVQGRLVLTERGRRATSQLNAVRSQLADSKVAGELGARLRDAPDAVLDPELFDLNEFSDRVLGIEAIPPVYRPRPSVSGERWRFVNGDGDEIGPDTSGLTAAQWAAIWAKLGEAAAQGRSYVQAEGFWFRVPPIEDIERGRRGEPAAPSAELVVATNLEEVSTSWEDLGDGVVVPVLPTPPPGLADGIALYEHQRKGLRWLAGHASWDQRSTDHGLLADDMGLGKTLQVLSLMSHLLEQGRLGPMLLVAPLSLLENWQREAEKFFPGRFGRPLVVGGTAGRRSVSADQVRRACWTLVSYDSLRRHQLELGRVRFELMVMDESHRIKNPTAGVTRAALAMQANRRLALSGTPVQNSLSDLWSQFDWLSPGWLGNLSDFDTRYADIGDAEALGRLSEELQPRILRRLKSKTLASELPALHHEGELYRPRLAMTPAQASLYEAVLRDKSADGNRGSFGLLHRLFQVCACPRQVGEPGMEDPKREWLMRLLADLQKKGEKVLIFAEWYALQDALIESIECRFDVTVDRVNGKVEAGDRLRRVERFNCASGFGALVLGPKAAGVGLNITGANHVVHYTRHWNPANEAQATDRAYRIGATRPVHVYRPIMEHPRMVSIEVHLDGLLREKSRLAEQVIVPTPALSVSADLKREIFG